MKKIVPLSSFGLYPSQSIAVVANDAGGALYISSLLEEHFSKLKFSLSGPAIEIFKKRWPELINLDLCNCLNDSKLLISGTSQSHINTEHKARLMARQLGINSVTVLDHWNEYKTRFSREKIEVLPDQIWVADSKAEELARKTFPNLSIQIIKINLYGEIIEETNYIHKLFFQQKRNVPPKRILYFTEPIDDIWPGGREIGEYQALEYWINLLPKLSEKGIICQSKNIEVKIRPHPSESIKKYERYKTMLKNKNINTTIDKTKTIEFDLAWSDATFGCSTQALVFSLKCKIPTYCTLPPWAPECCLPKDKLIMIKELFKN